MSPESLAPPSSAEEIDDIAWSKKKIRKADELFTGYYIKDTDNGGLDEEDE